MKRKAWMIVAAGLCAGGGALVAQELTARQLFYKEDAAPPKAAPKAAPKKKAPARKADAKAERPAVSTPAPVAAPAAPPLAPMATDAAYVSMERPLGLRYALAQVVNGAESEVDPNATFHSGDMVRVKVETNRDGYLYVIARGSSGNWRPLFPAPDINGGENHVTGHRGYRLPSDTQAFTFDEQAGQERLFVILSAEPVKDVDALIPSLATPSAEPKKDAPAPGPIIMASARPIDDEFVSRLRNTYSRDLIVQPVTAAQPAVPAAAGPATLPENAVYVVNRSGGRVIADITLEHK